MILYSVKELRMKKFYLLFSLLLPFCLSAADFTVNNSFLLLKAKENGSVEVHCAKNRKLYAVIRPDFGKEKVTAHKVERKHLTLLLLRSGSERRSLVITLRKNSFSISLNRTGKPVDVEWNASCVILPDRATEDIVLEKGKKDLRLPGFVNFYVGLLGKGEGILTCIPVKNTADSILSADLKTLTLHQKNTQEHIFVLNSRKGAWHKLDRLPAAPKGILVKDWIPPYPARWKALYPVGKSFLPSGDGLHIAWNVIRVTTGKKNVIENSLPRMTMTNFQTRTTWNGGFEGTYRYPVEFIGNQLKMSVPKHRGDRFSYDRNKPVYIYATHRLTYKAPAEHLPSDRFPRGRQPDNLAFTSNAAYIPTTCSSTEYFEKLFYRDEAKVKKAQLTERLWDMQCFVESIRSRVENARVWAKNLENYANIFVKQDPSLSSDAAILKGMLSDVEELYNAELSKMKQPQDVVKLSAQVIALVDNEKLDEEAKENQAKLLGRAIRTIGGTQDRMAGYMRNIGKNVRMRSVLNYIVSSTDAQRRFWKLVWQDTFEMLQGYYSHDGK